MPANKDDNGQPPSQRRAASWSFLSNHAHVLLCISSHGNLRLREVADRIGLTERAVQRIVADLEQAGYLSRSKDGRRNCYQLHQQQPLAHPLESHCTLANILTLACNKPGSSRTSRSKSGRKTSRRSRQVSSD